MIYMDTVNVNTKYICCRNICSVRWYFQFRSPYLEVHFERHLSLHILPIISDRLCNFFMQNIGVTSQLALWRLQSPASRLMLHRLFRCTPKKTPRLCVTGLCEGKPPVNGGFPSQSASYAENVSIWWRHHVLALPQKVPVSSGIP